jgi:hypothetical protein
MTNDTYYKLMILLKRYNVIENIKYTSWQVFVFGLKFLTNVKNIYENLNIKKWHVLGTYLNLSFGCLITNMIF